MGELQDTDAKRLDAWSKGYMKGQPDLLVLNRHWKYCGLAIEFKSPKAYGDLAADTWMEGDIRLSRTIELHLDLKSIDSEDEE